MRCLHVRVNHCCMTLRYNHTSCGLPALSLWVDNQPETEMYGLQAWHIQNCSAAEKIRGLPHGLSILDNPNPLYSMLHGAAHM